MQQRNFGVIFEGVKKCRKCLREFTNNSRNISQKCESQRNFLEDWISNYTE